MVNSTASQLATVARLAARAGASVQSIDRVIRKLAIDPDLRGGTTRLFGSPAQEVILEELRRVKSKHAAK